jgi:membrane-bound inhibitor of C-type lysozyme
MQNKRSAILCCAIILAGASDCAAAQAQSLTVTGGEAITCHCGNGEQIVARYYSLSDKSLDFVKVRIPDGSEYTLPQVLSGSGVRYSDDRELVWWTKGASAFAEMRTQNGEWQTKYDNCKETGKKQ